MTDVAETNWYSDDAATFGDRIAAAREAQSLTQKSLAKKLGVATKTTCPNHGPTGFRCWPAY